MQKNPPLPVLIVDDEEEMLIGIENLLFTLGINNVVLCRDSPEVEAVLESTPVSLVLLDLVMPGISGQELLVVIKAKYPALPVIIVTAVDDLNLAVSCMKAGAADFLLKPLNAQELSKSLSQVTLLLQLQQENRKLKQHMLSGKLENPAVFAPIVTRNSVMFQIFHYLECIAPSPQPVLITGEHGVGKELFARAIHTLSGRNNELVAVNISGLDDTVFSDTLFGHKQGAYTGAGREREGLVRKAGKGTLFLDEIGDLHPDSQAKLLRLIQEREYYSLGADHPGRMTARIIVATNKDLKRLIAEGRFKPDLYFRLRTHRVHIPPLRERLEDLDLLLAHFIARHSKPGGENSALNHPGVLALLRRYRFPGNIRELEILVIDALYTAGSVSPEEWIRGQLDQGYLVSPGGGEPGQYEIAEGKGIRYPAKLPTLKAATDALVIEAMDRCGGGLVQAARLLGISHQALSRRVKILIEKGLYPGDNYRPGNQG